VQQVITTYRTPLGSEATTSTSLTAPSTALVSVDNSEVDQLKNQQRKAKRAIVYLGHEIQHNSTDINNLQRKIMTLTDGQDRILSILEKVYNPLGNNPAFQADLALENGNNG
jgi:hypothetical protein